MYQRRRTGVRAADGPIWERRRPKGGGGGGLDPIYYLYPTYIPIGHYKCCVYGTNPRSKFVLESRKDSNELASHRLLASKV
jgi:hypothetical protein